MDALFDKERKARIDGNIPLLESIHLEIVNACNSEEELIQSLRSLINKRKQEQDSIKKLIRIVFQEHKQVNFLKNLLSRVIEGRIYLEEERIDICETLKHLLGNNIREAYDIIKDVPVETFTSISEKKRSHFLFEQIRLSLLLNKLQDTELFIRKVRKGYLDKLDKITFLNYFVLLRVGQNSFLEAAKLFFELNEIDESKKFIALGSLYCILSNCLSEGKDVKQEKRELLVKFYEFKNNDELMRSNLRKFCSDLIIDFGMIEKIQTSIAKYDVPLNSESIGKSIIEHNFFVLSKFFSNIKIDQAVSLMNVNEDILIDFISQMVNEKYCQTKINQKERVIFFDAKTWNNQVTNVLDKLVSASYLIHKENLAEVKD